MSWRKVSITRGVSCTRVKQAQRQQGDGGDQVKGVAVVEVAVYDDIESCLRQGFPGVSMRMTCGYWANSSGAKTASILWSAEPLMFGKAKITK